jgi:hypothetical protein
MSIKDLANKIAATVEEKGAAYGNAIKFSEVVFRELYPNGIPVEHYNNALLMARVLDKLKRLSTDPNAFGESPWEDIVGYGLRGAEKDQKYCVPIPNTSEGWKDQGFTYKLPCKGFWGFDKGGVHDLMGINSVVRGDPSASLKSGHAIHLEWEQAIKNQIIEKEGIYHIGDEDVYMAVDVLVELINDVDVAVSFDGALEGLFDIAWISLKDQGFTDEDLLLDN